MENTILMKMQHDMNIKPYMGEKKSDYIGRLVYSALCQWMRYCIMDETTKNYDRKSKSYILARIKSILICMTESFPEVKKWIFFKQGKLMDIDETVRLLRDKMIAAGELREIDENRNLGIPEYSQTVCTSGYYRIVGISDIVPEYDHVGITRVLRSTVFDQKRDSEVISIEDYLEWIYDRAMWNECNSIDGYEYFNPYSKLPPYQSWTSEMPNRVNMILARIPLYNGMHEYYLIKNENKKIFCSLLPEVLADWKEERRIWLALRKKVENPLWANYTYNDEVVILHLYCGLPTREQVVLDTYCWPLNSINDRYNYVVPKFMWNNIEKMLIESLGMVLKEKK